MVDPVLAAELAVAPFANWSKITMRHEVVSEYLAIPRASTSDVDRFASRLGMSRRMFYRLIKRRKERMARPLILKKITGRGVPINPIADAAVEEAILQLGAGVRPSDVLQQTVRISAVYGVKTPSYYTVRSRLRRGLDIAGLKSRLPSDCAFVLDASATELRLFEDGRVEAGWLLALFDLRIGRIAAHKLCFGRPDLLDVTELFLAAQGSLRSLETPATLAATPIILEHAHALTDVLSAYKVQINDLPAKTLNSGEALLMMFGTQVGNIFLRTRLRRRAEGGQDGATTMQIAKGVFDYLMRQWNCEAAATAPQYPGAGLTTPQADISTQLLPAPA